MASTRVFWNYTLKRVLRGDCMINIYTDIKFCKGYSRFMTRHDAWFSRNLSEFYDAGKLPCFYTKEILDAIKSIDKAEVLDYNLGTICTPYGITSVENLSTGCKAYINVLLHKMYSEETVCVDTRELGYNVISRIIPELRDVMGVLIAMPIMIKSLPVYINNTHYFDETSDPYTIGTVLSKELRLSRSVNS